MVGDFVALIAPVSLICMCVCLLELHQIMD